MDFSTIILTLVLAALLVFDLTRSRGRYRSHRKRHKTDKSFWSWWLSSNPLRLSLMVGGYLFGLLLIHGSDITLSLSPADLVSAHSDDIWAMFLTLAAAGFLFRDLRKTRSSYRSHRKKGDSSVPLWRWWFKESPGTLALTAIGYLLGLLLIYSQSITLDLPLADLLSAHSNDLWLGLLTLTAAGVLVSDRHKVRRRYQRTRRKQSMAGIPLWRWWLSESRVKLAIVGGGYLLGLLLIFDLTLSLPAFVVKAATSGILWGLLLCLLMGIYIFRDLGTARRRYRLACKLAGLNEPFRSWWFKNNRDRLALGGIAVLFGLVMIWSPTSTLNIPIISAIAAKPGAPSFSLFVMVLAGGLWLDLRLSYRYYRARRDQGRMGDAFPLWWLKNNPFKLVMAGGAFLFALTLLRFPDLSFDLPVFNMILSPQFLFYLFVSDPRILMEGIVTALLLTYLLLDMSRARFVFRNLLGKRGETVGFLRWWARKNRTRLAIAGGSYLVGLVVAFFLVPLAITHFGSGPARYLTSASNYFQQKKYQEAVLELRKAVDKEPDNAEIHLALAQALWRQGSLKESLAEVRLASKLDPSLFQAHLLHGTLALLSGDPSQALNSAQNARDLQPESVAPRLLLARALTVQQNFAEAAEHLRKAVQQEPDNAVFRLLLVANALARKDFVEANREAEAGLKQSANVDMYLLQASALQGLGRLDDAQAAIRSAAALDTKSPKPYLVMAHLALQRGDYRLAITNYEESLRRDPHNHQVLNNLAGLLVDHDFDLERAYQLADQAFQQAPMNPAVIDTLGWIYTKQGKYQEALPLLRQSAALAPEVPDVHYHLGVVLLHTGQSAVGRAELAQALKLSQTFYGADHARDLLKK